MIERISEEELKENSWRDIDLKVDYLKGDITKEEYREKNKKHFQFLLSHGIVYDSLDELEMGLIFFGGVSKEEAEKIVKHEDKHAEIYKEHNLPVKYLMVPYEESSAACFIMSKKPKDWNKEKIVEIMRQSISNVKNPSKRDRILLKKLNEIS